MTKISVGFALTATLVLIGCEGMFATLVQLSIEGPMPEPVIRLEQKLTVSEIRVDKFTGSKGKEIQRIQYWGVAATSIKQERNIGEIRYGHVPNGYHEYTAAKPLDYGYYYVSVVAHVHTIAGGAFIVVRSQDGKMGVLNIKKPYSYGDEVFACIHASRYIEDDVKNCLKK